jgi:excisionase family DNA binding protein
MGDTPMLTLDQAAQRLGVHYMTAYRYIRVGRLAGQRQGSRWLVSAADVERLLGNVGSRRAVGGRKMEVEADRLLGRLLAGDGPGSWGVVEEALVGGSATDVYLELLAPTLRRIGEGWAAGDISIGAEHQATALSLRLIGRLSPLFSRPGRRRRGTVVLAGAPGDVHAIPVAMLADVLRGDGFTVVDLGADVPGVSLLESLVAIPDLLAVGLSVSVDRHAPLVAEAVAAIHYAHPGVPVFVGGPAVTESSTAQRLGADHWAPDATGVADLLTTLTEADSAARR